MASAEEGYWVKPLSRPESAHADLASIVFVGDFYLEPAPETRSVSDLAASPVIDALRGASAAIVNLEGPLAGSGEPIPKVGSHMSQDRTAPGLLAAMGFDVACLANNHIMDYGLPALVDTVRACSQSGVLTVGAGVDARQAAAPVRLETPGGRPVRVLSFCEREFNVGEDGAGAAWVSSPEAERLVRSAAAEGDLVVVCAHGGQMDVPFPPVQRCRQLRRFVDAGADLVIGHHPHVPQGWESWRGRFIFYSLGDFLFGSAVRAQKPNRDWGLLVRALAGDGGIEGLQVLPVERAGRGVAFISDEGRLRACTEYLLRLSAITPGDALVPYWQEVAVRLTEGTYCRVLEDAVIGTPGRQPRRGVRLHRTVWLLRRILDLWFAKGRGPEPALIGPASERQWPRLLNALRCESHRWAMETALEVLGGQCEDRRSPDVAADVADLLAWRRPGP